MKRWTSVTTTTPIITSPIVLDEEKCDFNDGALSNEPTSKTFQTFDLATQVPVEVNVLPVATPAPEMTAKKPHYGSYGEITDETIQVQGSGSSAGDAIKTDRAGSADNDKKEPSAFTADVLQQSNHVQDNSADSPSISSFKPQQTEQASNAVISNNGSPQTKGTPKRLNYVQIIASKKNDPSPSQSSHTSSAGPNSHTPSAQTTPSHVILTHDAPAPAIRSKRANSSPSTNEVLYENSSSVRLMNLLMKQSTLPAMLPPINSTDNHRSPSHDYVNYEPITELSTSSTSLLQHSVDAEQSTQQNKSKGPPPSTKPKPSSSSGKALLQNSNEKKQQQQQFQQQQRSRFLSHPGPIAHLVKTGEGDEHIYLSPRQAGGNSSLPYKPYKELDFTTLDPESDYAVPKRLLENDDENDYCVPPQPVPVDSTDVFY